MWHHGYIWLLRILFLITVFSTASCLKSRKPGIPIDVVNVIQSTGINRVELTKAIGHYFESPDSLKLDAMYFLIRNLERHYAVEYEIKDQQEKLYHIDPFSFPTDILLFSYWDSLEITHEGFGFHAKKYSLDRDTITAELLVQTVEMSFEQWQLPHLNQIPKDIFFQYVLPYRIGNEYIDHWRLLLKPIADSIAGTSFDHIDSIAAAVNNYVHANFSFDARFLKNAFEQQTESFLKVKTGNDRDLSWFTVKLLRTLGIPSTVDYIPYLADSIHGFHFPVYYTSEGVFKPLLATKSFVLPLKMERIPKVYRRIFQQMDSSLFALKDIQKTTPPYLGHYDYLDVTIDYLLTKCMRFEATCPDSLIYAAVFNDKKWRPVDWALCTNDTAVFRQLGAFATYRFGYLDNESKAFVMIP